MEKEVKLFDPKFVHFMWDDSLDGKWGFCSSDIQSLQMFVEVGADPSRWKEGTPPYFLKKGAEKEPFMVQGLGFFSFAYYDPNYEAKWAYYKEGKKVQCKSCGEWVDCDTYPLWEDACQYRIKPESLGYARVETKGSDCDKQEGYTLAVSKCNWEDYIDHALPKENILDKPECPCADGIDSKACVGCEHSEDGKQYRPYRDALEFIADYGKRFPTATPRPLGTMPLIWIAHKTDGTTRLIVEFSDRSVKIGCKVKPVDFGKLFEYWTYTDGSPCGKEC